MLDSLNSASESYASIADIAKLRQQLFVLEGNAGLALAACDMTLIASGTATLEAALYKKPMVICYAMPKISWWMMGNRGYLPWVGLPNILANELIVPELLQDAATPHALADAMLTLWHDDAQRAHIVSHFQAMHASLQCDMPKRAAAAIAGLLNA